MNPLRNYIVPTLIIGEIPTFIFTFFDYYKLLSCYREKIYTNDSALGLGEGFGAGSVKTLVTRPYPTCEQMYQVFIPYIRNFIGILLLGIIGMETLIYTNLNPYDMSDDISVYRFLFEWFVVSFFTEFLFYWLHRYAHYNKKLYYWLHASHHKWRDNSFAIVNHDLEISEIAVFSLCPAIPCILYGTNWRVMMFHAFYTNWQGTYSHSGYHIPLLDYLLLVDSRNHDNHHKFPNTNFAGGSMFNLMDKIFGTHKYIT